MGPLPCAGAAARPDHARRVAWPETAKGGARLCRVSVHRLVAAFWPCAKAHWTAASPPWRSHCSRRFGHRRAASSSRLSPRSAASLAHSRQASAPRCSPGAKHARATHAAPARSTSTRQVRVVRAVRAVRFVRVRVGRAGDSPAASAGAWRLGPVRLCRVFGP